MAKTSKKRTGKAKAAPRKARKTTVKKAAKKRVRKPVRKWSASVTDNSDALDLENRVFKGTPSQIAASLKRSAERSRRRKASPYQSAMSMLNFYINRAGKNLSASRRRTLEAAKGKLREDFGR